MNMLTEKEKINIVNLVQQHGKKWKYIATLLPGRTNNTIKSFYISYEKHGTISPKRGRLKEITVEVENNLVNSVIANPEQTLIEMSSENDISRTTAKKILNEHHITYHNKIAVSPHSMQISIYG